MLYLTLTADQERELHTVSRQAVGRVALRAHMVLLSGRGYPVPQIALIHACGEDVVRTWLHRYAAAGRAPGWTTSRAAVGRPRTAWPSPLSTRRPASRPSCSGHVHALLDCGAADRLPGQPLPPGPLAASSVRRCLHAQGWRWARPRLAPATRSADPDPEAAAKLAALARRPGAGRGRGWRTCSFWTSATCTCCRWCGPCG